jgi:hypothetical protein
MPPQPFPVLYQLRLVERGPLDDKGEDAGWQATLKLGYGRDADDRTRACIPLPTARRQRHLDSWTIQERDESEA